MIPILLEHPRLVYTITMGNIVKPSNAVKFYIDDQVKKKDGSTLSVEDISDDILFGNNTTIGGVLLKSGEVVGAVIMVTDQAHEDLILQNIKKIKVTIANLV